MPFPSLLKYFSDDLAIDLGTANTLVFTRSGGIVQPVQTGSRSDDPGPSRVPSG